MSIIRRIKAGRPCGITQTTARAHGYTGDMRNLARVETAKQILLSDYGPAPGLTSGSSSTLLADELCDTGVNMGPSVASKFFQRWLTAMNMRGKLYPDRFRMAPLVPEPSPRLRDTFPPAGKRVNRFCCVR